MNRNVEAKEWGKYRRILQLVIGILVAIFILFTNGYSQSTAGYIYGKIYTIDNEYTGQLRWGKEEAFWDDHFNAAKLYKSQSTVSPEKGSSSWGDFDWRLSSIWDDKNVQVYHQFVVQFGDIQSIDIIGKSKAAITLKNGSKLEVGGEGYNDIGTSITVLDSELGSLNIPWHRIKRIEFMDTPSRLKYILGKPLYGEVETVRKGKIKGYIQWDHDERLSLDKLDGQTREGNVSVQFGNIKSIERYQNGSNVETISGAVYYVTGTNDVNHENRGIIVSVEGVGKIDIPWRAFKKVNLVAADGSGAAYQDYKRPQGIKAKVITFEGNSFSGNIVYDLDETWEVEMLEGKDDEIVYKLPFRNIKRIQPKNYDYSLIELRNGESLLLGGMRDVSDQNDGVLVIQEKDVKPVFIEWKNISEIVFK